MENPRKRKGKKRNKKRGVAKNTAIQVAQGNPTRRAGDSEEAKRLFFCGAISVQAAQRRQGRPQDYEPAMFWFQEAAALGYSDAQYCLGYMYLLGLGVGERDYEQAEAWLGKAARQGHTEAIGLLEVMYTEEREQKDTPRCVKAAAGDTSGTAQYAIGQRYYLGEGVEPSEEQAAAWFRKAAAQGHVHAQFNLGVMYLEGQGVDQDWAQAAWWHRRAAEQGDMDAQYHLAVLLSTGHESLAQDEREAVVWLRKAAAQGHIKAQFLLAQLLETGDRSVDKGEHLWAGTVIAAIVVALLTTFIVAFWA